MEVRVPLWSIAVLPIFTAGRRNIFMIVWPGTYCRLGGRNVPVQIVRARVQEDSVKGVVQFNPAIPANFQPVALKIRSENGAKNWAAFQLIPFLPKLTTLEVVVSSLGFQE